jgi:hypothetical protein
MQCPVGVRILRTAERKQCFAQPATDVGLRRGGVQVLAFV